jgi:N-acetylmuramoyl-L-alanine amidase
VARALAPMLEAAGARVVLTRPDTNALGLYERVVKAESADAQVFVSLHNNAFPDGVNPFVNSGTSVYYFHPQSVALAHEMQRALEAELRLRDLGISRGSYAVIRNNSWMPAVLTETMFMMVPEHAAALANPDVQRRIARAHLTALERFMRERGRPRD